MSDIEIGAMVIIVSLAFFFLTRYLWKQASEEITEEIYRYENDEWRRYK